jgi:hypothetical protein
VNVTEVPPVVDLLAATIAASVEGELGAVIVARTFDDHHTGATRRMIAADALVGSFSDFGVFADSVFDAVGAISVPHRPFDNAGLVMCDEVIFDRVDLHRRRGPEILIKCAPYPSDIEWDPFLRMQALAASPDVAIAPALADKIRRHPFDRLTSFRFDKTTGAPNVLVDALSFAFDVTMIDCGLRNQRRHAAALRRAKSHV